jgi:hypothetical protein
VRALPLASALVLPVVVINSSDDAFALPNTIGKSVTSAVCPR